MLDINISAAALVISALLFLLAIGGYVGAFFYWKGKTDKMLKDLCNAPAQIQRLETKMDIVFPLMMDQTLSGKPHLAKRGSGYKLTPEADKMLGTAVDKIIDEIKVANPDLGPSDVLIVLSQRIGMDEIQKISHDSGLSVCEVFSILTLKLGVVI